MAVIVVAANQKGGAGKSFTNTLLAKEFHKTYKKKVLILDCDFQGSLMVMTKAYKMNYPDFKSHFDIERSNFLKLKGKLEEHYNNYDYIFIDIPGLLYTPEAEKKFLVDMFRMADVVLVPLEAGVGELASTLEIYKVLIEMKEEKVKNGFDMDVYVFINEYQNTYENRQLVENSYEFIKNQGLGNIMESRLSNNVGYKRAYEYTPEAVTETSFVDRKHKKEFKSFVKEIYAITSKYED